MNTEQQGPAPRRLRYPVMVELVILGGIAAVLMIALSIVDSLVAERAQRAAAARKEIAASWGAGQIVGGPVILVPYRRHFTDANGKPQAVEELAHFLPQQLRVRGGLRPERRHRGIFESVLYRADLQIDGTFARPDFSGWGIAPEDILWNEVSVTVGIPDLRGISGNPMLSWSGRNVPFSGGSADPALWASGLTAAMALPPDGTAGDRYPFALSLSLNGSEGLGFYPLGGETIVALDSRWPDPGFSGAFLPESRTVSPNGFTARWNISSLGRSYPQRWHGAGDENRNALAALSASAFSVGLVAPVSDYQKIERSIKYGALFIVLTFLTFFLYELMSPVTLHPVQYFLVGGALCLFYLLLLSISEHLPFSAAYAIASAATVALICSYGAAIVDKRSRVAGLAGVLALLYGYLYVLLQLEDWALLMGSFGLFLILALVMYTTRRLDWGAAHKGSVREA